MITWASLEAQWYIASSTTAGDAGSIPRSGNSLEEEMATTPVFLPGNCMDRGTWWATVHNVTRESDTP